MRNARWRLRAGFALSDPWFTLNARAHAREGAGPLTWHADHNDGHERNDHDDHPITIIDDDDDGWVY